MLESCPPLPSDAPPLPTLPEDSSSEAIPPPPEPAKPEEPTAGQEAEDGEEEGAVEDEDDLEELERLAQKKLEILKAIDIELPDTVVCSKLAQTQTSEITACLSVALCSNSLHMNQGWFYMK